MRNSARQYPPDRSQIRVDLSLTAAMPITPQLSACVYEFVYAPVCWPAFSVSDMAIRANDD
jgi:hypothetical protein